MIIKMFCLVAQANKNHTTIFLTKAKKSKRKKMWEKATLEIFNSNCKSHNFKNESEWKKKQNFSYILYSDL